MSSLINACSVRCYLVVCGWSSAYIHTYMHHLTFLAVSWQTVAHFSGIFFLMCFIVYIFFTRQFFRRWLRRWGQRSWRWLMACCWPWFLWLLAPRLPFLCRLTWLLSSVGRCPVCVCEMTQTKIHRKLGVRNLHFKLLSNKLVYSLSSNLPQVVLKTYSSLNPLISRGF